MVRWFHGPGEARPVVGRLIATRRRAAEKPDAAAFNEYAWLLLTCEPTDLRDAATALAAATKANEMTGGTNARFLDTLALAYHRAGNTEKAREIQSRAIALLPPGESPLRSELEMRLTEYGSTAKGN